jgi:hypothetical protein
MQWLVVMATIQVDTITTMELLYMVYTQVSLPHLLWSSQVTHVKYTMYNILLAWHIT